MTKLNWFGYKVIRVDVIGNPERNVQGVANSHTKLVQLLHDAADNVVVHENVHVWQYETYPEKEYAAYWEMSRKMPYTIRPHEICARLVQYEKRTLEQSLKDLGWFLKDTKARLVRLWQRQIERAVKAAFEQARDERITELVIRENGIKITTASGRRILVMLSCRDSTEALVTDSKASYAMFESGQLYVRTTSAFESCIKGYIASIPRRL